MEHPSVFSRCSSIHHFRVHHFWRFFKKLLTKSKGARINCLRVLSYFIYPDLVVWAFDPPGTQKKRPINGYFIKLWNPDLNIQQGYLHKITQKTNIYCFGGVYSESNFKICCFSDDESDRWGCDKMLENIRYYCCDIIDNFRSNTPNSARAKLSFTPHCHPNCHVHCSIKENVEKCKIQL